MSMAAARVGGVGVPHATLWDPMTCPADLLPWLGWALSVDAWDGDWTVDQKRSAIAASIEVHRHKGTIGAVKKALEAVGYEVLVDEDTGEPYVFRLLIDARKYGFSAQVSAAMASAKKIAMATKNARSMLGEDSGLFVASEVGRINVLAVTFDGVSTTVYPEPS